MNDDLIRTLKSNNLNLNQVGNNLKRTTKIFNLVKEYNACDICKLGNSTFQKPNMDIKNTVISDVQAIFISDFPSREDTEFAIPFTGVSGLFFRKAIHDAEISEFNFILTYALLCRRTPFVSQRPKKAHLENCSERIHRLLALTNPKTVIFVGTTSRDFYTPKLKQWGFNPKIHTIHHPAYILKYGGSDSDLYRDWVFKIKSIFEFIQRK